jgi:hypothetical protein
VIDGNTSQKDAYEACVAPAVDTFLQVCALFHCSCSALHCFMELMSGLMPVLVLCRARALLCLAMGRQAQERRLQSRYEVLCTFVNIVFV